MGTSGEAKTLAATLCTAVMITTVWLQTGCTSQEQSTYFPKPRFVMVLVDETGSFVNEWKAMRDCIEQLVVPGLQPGEGFGLIGIDDQGFQPDDVRIKMLTLDQNPLKAKIQKEQLAAEVGRLERRSQSRPFTDVVGAVRHAEYFFKSEQDHRPALLIFSDMRQTPRMPTPADFAGLRFPEGTEAHCLFVDASGWVEWQTSVGHWVKLLTAAGVKITANDFHQKGRTSQAIGRILAGGQ